MIVSPRFVYYEVMNTDDLPLIFLILVGVVFLFLTYFFMVLIKLFMAFTEIKNTNDKKIKSLIFYLSLSFLGGFLVNFSNFPTAHYLSIFMLFVSIKNILISPINFLK